MGGHQDGSRKDNVDIDRPETALLSKGSPKPFNWCRKKDRGKVKSK